jgi:hypothetical protein
MEKQVASGNALRILRREDSLSSRQYGGICVRVIYQWDGLEILCTDMDAGAVLEDSDIGSYSVLHVVVGGSPVFRVANETNALMPGDSIALRDGQHCRVSNPTSSRSSILSFLVRRSETSKRDKTIGTA